jgi:hypothetical protein
VTKAEEGVRLLFALFDLLGTVIPLASFPTHITALTKDVVVARRCRMNGPEWFYLSGRSELNCEYLDPRGSGEETA